MHTDLRDLAPPISFNSQQGGVSVRTVSPGSLDDTLIEEWRCLSERSLEPNAYLTPMFILPTLAHLGSLLPVVILLIETANGDLIGIGIFNTKPLAPFFPLQSLVGFRSKHSYLSGLLVDRDHASTAVEAFFAFVSSPENRWHGVRFDRLSAESSLGSLLIETARRRNIWWSESERMHRAVLRPKRDDRVALISRISTHRLKDLRRCLRRLGETGKSAWRVRSGKDVTDDVIERFIFLEHMGWKGEAGTSLRSHPAHEQFFTTMVARFRDSGGVFFTELLHDDVVIASTCNLISGNSAFAFKIGWHPHYAKYSPGMLNELGLLERGNEIVGRLDLIDSGSVEGSFIDKLWCDKRDVVSGTFATTRSGKLICMLAAARRHTRLVTARLHGRVSSTLRVLWPVHKDLARSGTAVSTVAAISRKFTKPESSPSPIRAVG